MDNVEHTLVKVSEKNPEQKKSTPLVIEQGLMISPPYSKKEWDVNRMFISPPVSGTSKTGGIGFNECKVEYEYILPDGTKKRARLQIDFPNEPNKRAKSIYGITEILKYMDPAEVKKLPPGTIREGTGKHQIMCSLQMGIDTTTAFINMIREIYDKCLTHMQANGNGRGCTAMLGPVRYAKPTETTYPEFIADHLKYPLSFILNETRTPEGGTIVAIDPTGIAKIGMSVKIGGRYGVTMVDQDAKPMFMEDIVGQGFEHVPLMVLDNLYIGAKSKIRFSLWETIITKMLPPRTLQLGNALDAIKKHEAATKASLAADARTGFDDLEDLPPMDTELPLDTEVPDQESGEEGDLPPPVATPLRTPVSPVKSLQGRSAVIHSPSRVPGQKR